MEKRLSLLDTYLRKDLPSIEVGDKVEIVTKFFENSEKKVKFNTFRGTVIAQKNKNTISYTLKVLKESQKIMVTSVFSYHSPLIKEIKKIGKANLRIRRAKLYYLERLMARKKANE